MPVNMILVLISVDAYFEGIFDHCISAFRSGHSCQTTLITMTESWRKALDENKYIGVILTDLSKAFDCLPHTLLLAKLKAYGLGDSVIKLLESYLTNRKQFVCLGSFTSVLLDILKGVPQGSILGPLLFMPS